MDEELKQYLGAMESRNEAHMATTEARMLDHMAATETRMFEHMAAMESRLREHVETVETRLLGEFWKWARTADARYRQHHGEVNGLIERVALVEDRIAELERGK